MALIGASFLTFQVIAQFNNVFDSQYYTAAQLQGTAFTSTGNFIARPFPAVAGEFPSSKPRSMRQVLRPRIGSARGSGLAQLAVDPSPYWSR